jgi:hypothetical protein
MRPIVSKDDLAAALSADQTVIYFFVEWSEYAVRGRQRFADLELSFGRDSGILFCLADVSSIEASGAFVADWLESQDVSLFTSACAGNGPTVWLKRGVITQIGKVT